MFGLLKGRSLPAVNRRYWILMSLASIAGCNLGDCCSYYFGWNHWIGLGPLTILFLAILILQDRFAWETELWYWSLILILRAAATNLADLLTHTYDLKYINVFLGLGVLQMLFIWLSPTLSRSSGDTFKPTVNRWYWLCLLTAGALGTVLGDSVADASGLGTGFGTLLLAVPVLVTLLVRKLLAPGSAPAYWLPVLAIRAAGTTAGDWIAFHEEPGMRYGAGIGLAPATMLTVVAFITVFLFWKKDRPAVTA